MAKGVSTNIVGLAIVLVIGALLLAAFVFYNDIRGTGAERSQVDGVDLCNDPDSPDRGWSWYTRNFPAPGTEWRVFSTRGVVCLSVGGKMRSYAIKDREVRLYGCFASRNGMFCQSNATPEKHPKADDYMG